MLTIQPTRRDDLQPPIGFVVSFYGARHGNTFDSWRSLPMSYARALRLKGRIERRHKRAIEEVAR